MRRGFWLFFLMAVFFWFAAPGVSARCRTIYYSPGTYACYGGDVCNSACELGTDNCCSGARFDCSRQECCNDNNWGGCSASCGGGSQTNGCGDRRSCNNQPCNAGPVLSGVSISSLFVRPDNSTTYTIGASASDPDGASDVRGLYALINYQGTNAGAHRGYLMWHQNQTYPSMKDHRACGGSGFGNIYSPGYGDSYLRLDACSVSGSGNSKTASFTVRFDPSFTSPVSSNDISGYTFDAAGAANGWTNYDINFSLTLSGTLNVSTSPGSIRPNFDVKNSGGSVVGSGTGPGPVALTLTSGAYTVEFLPFAGYTTPGNRSVNLSSGQSLSVSGDYTAQPGTLSIRTLPFNAGISVDGSSWGSAPQTRTVSAGTHRVIFADVAGYVTPPTRQPVVYSNQTTTVTETYNRGQGAAPAPTLDRLLFQSIFVWREVAP